MTHDWSPLSGLCLACGTPLLGAGPECQPSAAEPEDAEAALAELIAVLEAA